MKLAHADALKADLVREQLNSHAPAPLDGPVPVMTAGSVPGVEPINPASNAIIVLPVSKSCGHPIFMMPADGEEGARFRRLARQLPAEWSLSLVRPVSSWHQRTVDAIEDAAAQSVAAIRAAQPSGPYIIGGFCYGGVVAAETVRLLELEGQTALLVLFDTPTPGYPNFSTDLHIWVEFLLSRAKIAWRTKSPKPLLSYARRTLRMAVWFVVRHIGPKKTGRWKAGPVHWLWHQAQSDYFSFYTPKTTTVPILHFMADDEADVLMKASRHGWGKVGNVTKKWLPGNHDRFFLDKSNLPTIAEALSSWLEAAATARGTRP